MEISDEMINEWFDDMNNSTEVEYTEPIIEMKFNCNLKMWCGQLKQDNQVFITALQILDKYAYKKHVSGLEMAHINYASCAAIYLANKGQGGVNNKYIPMAVMEAFAATRSGSASIPNPRPTIKDLELDILNTLGFQLPLASRLDDTMIVAEKLKRAFNLPQSVITSSSNALEFTAILWKRFITRVKSLFENEELFLKAIRKRIFVPLGTAFSALKSECNHVQYLNIEDVLNTYATVCGIDPTILDKLTDIVHEMVQFFENPDTMNTSSD